MNRVQIKRFACFVFSTVLVVGLASVVAAQERAHPLADESLAEPSIAASDVVTPTPGENQSLGAEVISKVRAAGWIGYVLLALSVIGVACAVERLVNLRRKHVVPVGLADRVLSDLIDGRYDAATEACRQRPSTLGRTLNSVARHHDFSFNDLAVITGDIGVREIRQHLQRAYPLAMVATLGPLLGLLGTVIGMIDSFEAVALAGSMGDPSVMASSISFALITTAIGLLIAAPNLALYHIFRVRTNNLAAMLDEQVSEVLLEWQARRARIRPQHESQSPRVNNSADREPLGADTNDVGIATASAKDGGFNA